MHYYLKLEVVVSLTKNYPRYLYQTSFIKIAVVLNVQGMTMMNKRILRSYDLMQILRCWQQSRARTLECN